jgi:DeoR/GlpR family transcriptional regulator of sugar metabolism
MGATCFSLAQRMITLNLDDAEFKRAAIEHAAKVILVRDSAKLHTHTLAAVGPVEMIHVLVTDAGLAEADRELLAARGVEVVIAEG